MELIEIVKPITGSREYYRGEVIDATGWRNLQALLRCGRIRRYYPPDKLKELSITPVSVLDSVKPVTTSSRRG